MEIFLYLLIGLFILSLACIYDGGWDIKDSDGFFAILISWIFWPILIPFIWLSFLSKQIKKKKNAKN